MSLNLSTTFSGALGLMEYSARFVGAFMPGHEMQEAQNKVEAFRLFACVDRELGFPGSRPELQFMVRRAKTLTSWPMIFALEGVSHHYASGASSDDPLTGMLSDPELPDSAMVPMHSGMGTAIAGSVLARLGENPSKAALRGALEKFLNICRENSRAGWYVNAIEAIGLAVRTLNPRLLQQASTVIGEIDREAQSFYWHGVGRSLYFVPTNFMTVANSHARALRSAVDEAPTVQARCDAIAGLAWAVTLVNLRYPAVVENLVRVSPLIRMPAAVTNGIVSALMAWKHMVPDSKEVARYLAPASPTARATGLWSDMVSAPASEAFEKRFPALIAPYREGRQTIASLFAYQDFGDSGASRA
jgi:hypothetical protein